MLERTARVALKGHVYHVLTRGINLQDIFEDREDCRKYLYPYLEQDEPRADSTPFLSDFAGIHRIQRDVWNEGAAVALANRLKDMGLTVDPTKTFSVNV